MPQYLAALMIVLLLGTVLGRVLLLHRTGTRAMYFGELDKTDFLITAGGIVFVSDNNFSPVQVTQFPLFAMQ